MPLTLNQHDKIALQMRPKFTHNLQKPKWLLVDLIKVYLAGLDHINIHQKPHIVTILIDDTHDRFDEWEPVVYFQKLFQQWLDQFEIALSQTELKYYRKYNDKTNPVTAFESLYLKLLTPTKTRISQKRYHDYHHFLKDELIPQYRADLHRVPINQLERELLYWSDRQQTFLDQLIHDQWLTHFKSKEE